MNEDRDSKYWHKYATEYDPIKIGSIDGTDREPHDRAIVRALRSEYRPDRQVRGEPAHTLFAARLNPRTTQETIESEFGKFGRIVRCRLVRDLVTGRSRQYAFVEYSSAAELDRALRACGGGGGGGGGVAPDGAAPVVEREAERRLRGWRPRRLGGGLGGRREAGQLRFGGSDRPFQRPIAAAAPHRPRPRPRDSHARHTW